MQYAISATGSSVTHNGTVIASLTTQEVAPNIHTVISLFVHPDHRRKGIATELLRRHDEHLNGGVVDTVLHTPDAEAFAASLTHHQRPTWDYTRGILLSPPAVTISNKT